MKHSLKYVALSVIAFICTMPLIILLLLSFSKFWQFPNIFPRIFTTENWADLFVGNNNILRSFSLSAGIALPVAFISTIMGFITANFIANHKKRNQLLLLTYFPFALSPVIFAVCLRFYFIKSGLAGSYSGVAAAQLIITFPYCVIFFISFFNERIKQYGHLVNTLGGNNFYAFKKAILPAAKPFFAVCFFQCFLISWFEYGLTSIIGYGKIQTLTVTVFQYISEANIFQAALSCCLLIIPPVILLWVNKKILLQQAH